jgi:hypothetical protein
MQYSELDLVRMTPRNRGDVLTQLQRQIDSYIELDWLTDDEAEHCLYIERLVQLLWALPTQISETSPVGYYDGRTYQYIVVAESRDKAFA